MESLGKRKNIRVYPGNRKLKCGGEYEQYKEAWNLLLDEEYAQKQRYTSKQLCRMENLADAQSNTL
jgi:hypothetical protein